MGWQSADMWESGFVYILARGQQYNGKLNHPLSNELLYTQKWYLPQLKSEQIVLSQFTVLNCKTRKWKTQVSNALSPPKKKTRSGWKVYEEIFSYKRSLWAVISAVERSSSVCLRGCACVYTVSAYGKTSVLQTLQQSKSITDAPTVELGDDMTPCLHPATLFSTHNLFYLLSPWLQYVIQYSGGSNYIWGYNCTCLV